jgi:hypothetical protein
MADLGLDVLLFLEFCGRPGDQSVDVADNLADVIGYASGGIGRVSAPLVSDNFKLRILAAGLGSGTHACSISPDH